jgi:predicted nuclease of predicted toxin-antitoxin system
MKLLVDECLSEELSLLARERGHADASHIAWIGKRGWKDWELMEVILAGDWTFFALSASNGW